MFHICSIVNDPIQAAALMSSLASAGFDGTNSRIELFDNSRGNTHDPFHVLNEVVKTSTAPYLLFCHQDVRFDRGHGYGQLVRCVEELTRSCPHWAVAGNAGMDDEGRLVLHIVDPHGDFVADNLPRAVVSLDENFLVVRAESGVRCSTSLSGFHLYATDLCLNASLAGRTCHVIDFRLHHLSGGDPTSTTFAQSLSRLVASWNPRVLCCIVETTTGSPIRLARRNIFRRLLRRPGIAARLRRRGLGFVANRTGGALQSIVLDAKIAWAMLLASAAILYGRSRTWLNRLQGGTR